MKSRIIYSLLLLFILFLTGSGLSMLYLYKTTNNMKTVIDLHKVEIIRQELVINAQTVQSHLYTFGSEFGQELDIIVENVITLDTSAQRCLSCHHNKEITQRLEQVISLVEQYQDSLSYLITTTANPERVKHLRMVAIGIGNTLLDKVQEMATIAGAKLKEKSFRSLKEINNSRTILIITLILSFFIALAIAISMTRHLTEPIYELLDATRHIKAGELGYTTRYKGTNEFNELIEAFNDMSISLDLSNKKIMRNLHNLSNLYSVTLSFHSVTHKADIYRELSYGVASLVGADQCGLMLRENGSFLLKYPAIGLDNPNAALAEIPEEVMLQYYHPSNRKAYLHNTTNQAETPEILRGTNIKNLMFIWIKQKGELIGAIRVSNKRSGDFTEDDVRPLAILANNVSVALENTKLYDDLRKQMKELSDTQDQLVQAAKLVAIGELASNIAHEINNPLTSILGYTELMKEEEDLDSMMKDLDVIEKESLRARAIVHQLLEFSRKRSMHFEKVNMNNVMRDVLELLAHKLKATKIRLDERYDNVAPIMGDENQLKQVFLNLINNAIFAMSGDGILSIATANRDGYVCASISDTGIGIPKEVIQRIFEPFFSTKKEKGTGIGLSVSYKIVQGHNGHIEVESEHGMETKFTVVIPKVADEVRPSIKSIEI